MDFDSPILNLNTDTDLKVKKKMSFDSHPSPRTNLGSTSSPSAHKSAKESLFKKGTVKT